MQQYLLLALLYCEGAWKEPSARETEQPDIVGLSTVLDYIISLVFIIF